jgi:hypothetical protein
MMDFIGVGKQHPMKWKIKVHGLKPPTSVGHVFLLENKVTYGLVDQAFSSLWFYELPVFRNTLELLAS